ncbi:MAG: ribosomal protein S18-alanine N-acetyltransferase [bacterium]
MTILPFAPEHLDRVVALEQEIYAGQGPWARGPFEHELVAPFTLWRVGLEEDAVVAYGGGWLVSGEFHLLNLAVATSHRRQGCASALLKVLLAEASRRGCREALLEVRRGNETARALYDRFGFLAAGIRTGYYPDGEDAVLYTRFTEKSEGGD